MKLALFDLDHTLLPFDSGMAWTRFLVGRGVLPPSAADDYLAACQRYVDGTLDIRMLHRQAVMPLASLSAVELQQLGAAFAESLAPRVPASHRAWVLRHRRQHHACVLVTATTRFLAAVVAPLFGIDEVLATKSALDANGRLNGEIVGEPCYREHKLAHVQRWLATRDLSLADCERSWFYSDSMADLPLLRAVSDPVVVRPDARLRALATAEGWPILEGGPDPAPG
ncbi:HAD family hydrolase [Rivibacter subsaxonicus]|uniref:HAD superfamily hydrolase (TIGR01490 family) n=1 Tax=Rivibacter subsaxonicus TaxID=457575 RepID=A0A4Q7W0G6_9BURK|nr:HAD-IB family hydrolase [Rivibacter subsaxonicus]RZU02702.1 HAD superfamily hydrolase (TIGR01490 family) [Rivibacter subsaxonicus]